MSKMLFFVLACLLLIQPAFAKPGLDVYGKLPGVELMELSPSGKRYAFVALVGETRRLGVVTDDGKLIFTRSLGELKTRQLEWAGNNHLLVWTSATFDHPLDFEQAYEFSVVSNINLETGAVNQIFGNTQKMANIVMGDAGFGEAGGKLYGYFVGMAYRQTGRGTSDLDPAYTFTTDNRNLYRVDLETNAINMHARGGSGRHFDWVLGNNDQNYVRAEYEWREGQWQLFKYENGRKLLLEKQSPFGDVELLGRGRTADTVLVADGSTGTSIVDEISLADGKATTLVAGASTSGFLFDPDTALAIGVGTVEEPRVTFFDNKLQARFNGTRKAFPGLEMQLISFTHNLDRMIVKTDAGDDSGTYWLVDIATGSAKPIGYAYPEIKAADVGPTQWINYKTTDGLEISAVLTLPPGRTPKNLPLIMLPHGGPIGVNDGLGFDWWAQAFAAQGYAVLQPNYRGSSGSGKDFLLAGYGQWGRGMQTDLSDGVAALAKQEIIDPKRVCIVGASYGGYAALAGVTLQHNIYRCAVSVAGPSDLGAFFRWQIERNGYRSDNTRFWRAVTGADKNGDDSVNVISPARQAAKADSPILLIHGKDDTVVPIAQSEAMADALKKAGKTFEYMEMDEEDHWLSRSGTRTAMLKASITFVEKHNPPN